MTDRAILNQIKLLKEIKPRQEWVLLTKQSILGIEAEKQGFSVFEAMSYLSYLRKPSFAMASFALIILGGFAIGVMNVQKEAKEAQELAVHDQILRLKIAQADFDSLYSDFAQLVENQPKKALQASRAIVQLQKDKTQIEKVLGAKIGQDEDETLETATKALLENEFADLETRTLSENQRVMLKEAKDAFDSGDYQAALEKIWILSNVQ